MLYEQWQRSNPSSSSQSLSFSSAAWYWYWFSQCAKKNASNSALKSEFYSFSNYCSIVLYPKSLTCNPLSKPDREQGAGAKSKAHSQASANSKEYYKQLHHAPLSSIKTTLASLSYIILEQFWESSILSPTLPLTIQLNTILVCGN